MKLDWNLIQGYDDSFDDSPFEHNACQSPRPSSTEQRICEDNDIRQIVSMFSLFLRLPMYPVSLLQVNSAL